MAFMKFYKENGKVFKAYPKRDQSKTKLTLANMKIVKLDHKSELYHKRVQEFNDGMIYHYSGKWYATEAIKTKDMKTLKKDYIHSGKWGIISAAHASNALVVIMKPDEGIYSLCTGPAIRGAAPISPDLAISIYNERNAFWDIELADTPERMVEQARKLAIELIGKFKAINVKYDIKYVPKDVYHELLTENERMEELENYQEKSLHTLNKLMRCYTRIHVLARQFIHFFDVPEKFIYNG